MLFNSYEFILVFFPIVVCLYYLLSKANPKNGLVVLALSSIAFYAYWEFIYVFIIIGSIIINYYLSFYVRSKSKPYLILAIVLNLGVLAYFKYTGLIFDVFELFVKGEVFDPKIILPIGISFFTFQQIAFQVDSYYNKTNKPTFIEYVFFVTFFPQLIAGPIVHHSEIFSQVNIKSKFFDNFAIGLSIFSIGLFKKIIIADNIALTASSVFLSVENGVTPNFIEAWFGALAYTLQIYFDVSAYSDMAIGLAFVFGFKLPQNFASPYQSTSITEFWRRWHITLSRFVKNYLYIPLGGNRKGSHRAKLNVLIAMTIAGLWHGAAINFIFWGFLHGLFLVVQQQFSRYREKFGFNRLPDFWAWLMTITCVVFAWVPFRANSWGDIFVIWKSMLTVSELKLPAGTNLMGIPTAEFLNYVDYQQGALILTLILVTIFMPNVRDIFENFPHCLSSPQYFTKSRSVIIIRWKPTWLWALIVSLLFLISLSNLSVYSEFLYFQF